ncbi:MAG: hypothetical protein JWM82_843 [Myxococcales bacterium]|jgi:uncharacterized protein YecE (DUF72 family)|nr:hypothetical protein [Myxococcales bacterium]
MAKRGVFVGTAGWSVPRAVAARFPIEGSALARYAQRFSGVEINSTFWRRHQPGTFARWHDTVPTGFEFSLKLPRTITHDARLRGARALLREFFDDIAGLGKKLGPLLIQLPPSLSFDARVAGAFLRTLRGLHGGAVVCEPRHTSWFTPAGDALLAAHEIGRVAADPPRVPGGDQPGGFASIIYYRLHGSPVMYRSAYGAARLATLAKALREAATCATVWCMFDNTASGAAAADGLELMERLER